MTDHGGDKLTGLGLSPMLIKGAEVVRTTAVSYATPIVHKVYIQDSTLNDDSRPTKLTIGGSMEERGHPIRNLDGVGGVLFSTPSPVTSIATRSIHPLMVSRKNSDTTSICTVISSSSCISSSSVITISSGNCQPSSVVSVCSPKDVANVSSRNDDELTSLSWLQDLNLLKGTLNQTENASLSPVKSGKTSSPAATVEKRRQRSSKKMKTTNKVESSSILDVGEPLPKVSSIVSTDVKIDSPTSDYGEEFPEATEDQVYVNGQAIYDPKLHTKEKPPFSFSTLIFMAIEASRSNALPVKDIYSWILDHYPYYKTAPTGWKNSVRHNLSLNKCFCKVDKSPTLGKGSLWMVDQTYRPNLVQAVTKGPLMLSSNHSFLKKYFVRSTADDVSSNSKKEGLKNSPSEEASLSNITCTLTSKVTLSSKEESGNSLSADSKEIHTKKTSLYGPDPELFPRLAKRLELHVHRASSGASSAFTSVPIDVKSEDVDAAAAMLVLKHGPRMLKDIHRYDSSIIMNNNSGTSTITRKSKLKPEFERCEFPEMVISSSPSLDHAYVSDYVKRDARSLKKDVESPSSSTDEAFYDDSSEKDSRRSSYCHQFQYRSSTTNNDEGGLLTPPLEEATALLNLASIATSLAFRLESLDCPEPDIPTIARLECPPLSTSSNARLESSPVNASLVPRSDSSDQNQVCSPESRHLTSKSHHLTSKTPQENTFINHPCKRKLLATRSPPCPKKSKVSDDENESSGPKINDSVASCDAKNNVSRSIYNNNNGTAVDRNKFKRNRKRIARRKC